MSSLKEFVTANDEATVEPRLNNHEFVIATQSGQSEESIREMMESKGAKRVLKRSPFTRVQALAGCVQLPRYDVHMEPLASDLRDSGTDNTSGESDTAEFFDFDDVPPLGMDYFGVPTPATSQPVLETNAPSKCMNDKCDVAESSIISLHEKDSLTDFLLDQEQLSSETKSSLEDIPCTGDTTEQMARFSDDVLRKGGGKLFEPQSNLGRDAIKYWPPPSLPEAFHLSEAIIKFTRDVEAARNQEI